MVLLTLFFTVFSHGHITRHEAAVIYCPLLCWSLFIIVQTGSPRRRSAKAESPGLHGPEGETHAGHQ
ncbi:MAG TPA: hypothetical protein VMV53_09065 [Acidimicrobiales bacterium]|nr:hypothetical protein [Acidimicrobiales bacterium]